VTGTLSSETNNSGYENMKSLATQIYNDYSHNKRQWTQRKYTNNQFIRLLNTISDNTFTNLFTPNSVMAGSELEKNYSNYHFDDLYKEFRNLELCTNNIKFEIYGDLSRDAGQFLTLNVGNINLKPMLNSVWQIYSCRHVWDGKVYTNELVAFRTMAEKPIITAKEEK
jgi:hypothetical protein